MRGDCEHDAGIQTYLSEVNTVVFVAERMPTPEEITGAWIRRYDWILARALLDESLHQDLTIVRTFDPRASASRGEIDGNIQRLMETLSGDGLVTTAPGVPDYSSVPGTIPDLHHTQQSAYEREVARKRAYDEQVELPTSPCATANAWPTRRAVAAGRASAGCSSTPSSRSAVASGHAYVSATLLSATMP